jgi:hypothetical protein
MPADRSPPDECANCGARLPRSARSCPECGADERTGWRENDDTRYDGLDLPASAFEDDAASAASRKRRRPAVNGLAWYWWLAGILVLVLLVAGALGLG